MPYINIQPPWTFSHFVVLQHDATTNMFHCEDNVLWAMDNVGFPPSVAPCAKAKRFMLDPIRPDNLYLHAFCQTPNFFPPQKCFFFPHHFSIKHNFMAMVVVWKASPIWAVDLSSPFRVTHGCFFEYIVALYIQWLTVYLINKLQLNDIMWPMCILPIESISVLGYTITRCGKALYIDLHKWH